MVLTEAKFASNHLHVKFKVYKNNRRELLYNQTTVDDSNAWRYYLSMIKSFQCKETEKIFERRFVKKFSVDIQRLAYRKLVLLDSAEKLEDLKVPPGNRLEKLAGNRQEQHSIRINDQWRICFNWSAGDAYEVEITDYH